MTMLKRGGEVDSRAAQVYGCIALVLLSWNYGYQLNIGALPNGGSLYEGTLAHDSGLEIVAFGTHDVCRNGNSCKHTTDKCPTTVGTDLCRQDYSKFPYDNATLTITRPLDNTTHADIHTRISDATGRLDWNADWYIINLFVNGMALYAAFHMHLMLVHNEIDQTQPTMLGVLYFVTALVIGLSMGGYHDGLPDEYMTTTQGSFLFVGLLAFGTALAYKARGLLTDRPDAQRYYKWQVTAALICIAYGMIGAFRNSLTEIAWVDIVLIPAFLILAYFDGRNKLVYPRVVAFTVFVNVIFFTLTSVKYQDFVFGDSNAVSNSGRGFITFAWTSQLLGLFALLWAAMAQGNRDGALAKGIGLQYISAQMQPSGVQLQPSGAQKPDRASLVRNDLKLDLNV